MFYSLSDTFMESLSNPHEVAHAVKNALKRSHALMPHNNRTILLKLFEGTSLPASLSMFTSFPLSEHQNEPIENQIAEIQPELIKIGPRNYECLRLLMSILSRVNDYSSVNDMTANNLATVFTPILMPSVFAGPPTNEEYNFLCLLIVHYHEVFRV